MNTIPWVKAPKHLKDFSGLHSTRKIGNVEQGIFKERYGEPWGLYRRPLDANGNPTDCWSSCAPCRTLKQALEMAG